MSCEHASILCVKVPRVLDWINTSSVIKSKEKVHLDDIQLHDTICCNFSVPCGKFNPTTLWTTYGIGQIGGTICINYHNGNGHILEVFVNGEKKADVIEGSSFSGTFTFLQSIEVQYANDSAVSQSCYGEFKIMFHYYPNERSNFNSVQEIKEATCFLSDQRGMPLSLTSDCSVTCKELTRSKNRSNIYVQNALGETIMVQCIDYLIQGFICVQFLNDAGEICFQCVFPFSEVETAFLCAPPGTKVTCQTIDLNCRAHIIPSFSSNANCLEVVIILSICLCLKSIDEVIIELKGAFSHPRQELMFSSCNTRPPTG